jgi:predicted dehydrogenase
MGRKRRGAVGLAMGPVRVGMIGYWASGAHHARAFGSIGGARLVAVAACSEESSARARGGHFVAAVYGDHREMLADEGLDAVAVVLPSHPHGDVAAGGLRSRRHLPLEKPMSLGLDAGERYDPARVGSWVLEVPIHFFDLARRYFAAASEPEAVVARASGTDDDRPAPLNNFSALVDPRVGGLRSSRRPSSAGSTTGWRSRQGGTASRGGAMGRTLEPAHGLKLMRGGRVEEVAIDRPSGEVYEPVDQAAEFVRAVREGTPPPCSGGDGRWSVALCLGADVAIRTGEAVRSGAEARGDAGRP